MAAGATVALAGLIVLCWGAYGRFFDRHSWSEDDGTMMEVGAVFVGFGLLIFWVAS